MNVSQHPLFTACVANLAMMVAGPTTQGAFTGLSTHVLVGELPSVATQTVGSTAQPSAVNPQYAEILALHNTHRGLHGAPALTWDADLAAAAATWAAKCVFQHPSSTTDRIVNGQVYGQNIAASYHYPGTGGQPTNCVAPYDCTTGGNLRLSDKLW